MSWTDSLVFPLLDSTHLPNLFDFERFRCDRKKVWKQSHPPLTIDAFGNLASGDVKNYRQGRAQWWRCWCWHGQEGSVSWRCSWRCWDYSLTSCKDVKTKCQFIGEATTTYHDVKIQMQWKQITDKARSWQLGDLSIWNWMMLLFLECCWTRRRHDPRVSIELMMGLVYVE